LQDLNDIAMATTVWPKWAKISKERHINAEFGFEIGRQRSANSSVTLPDTRDKGELPQQPIFGHKLL